MSAASFRGVGRPCAARAAQARSRHASSSSFYRGSSAGLTGVAQAGSRTAPPLRFAPGRALGVSQDLLDRKGRLIDAWMPPPAAWPAAAAHRRRRLPNLPFYVPPLCSSSRQRRPLHVVAGEPVWWGDRDSLKEDRLRLFRVVYNHESWAAHRSTRRYIRHFMGMFRSRIVSGLKVPLLLIAIEATLVCVYEWLFKAHLLPAAFRSIQVKAPMLFSLSSFALSLLLVFRTNQSYARFDEGRRLWSVMANRCRDVMRQSCSYLGPNNQGLLGVLCRWMQAFPWIMKNYLREKKSWEADLGALLTEEELAVVLAAPNPPLMALQIVTEIFDRMPISTKQRIRLDAFCSDLGDVVGASERLMTTPIPLSYTRHTARFLVIWLALLPFSIYSQCGWVTIFSSVVLGFFLLSIEEIGVTIEEPFNILPLEAINTRVCRDMARFPKQMPSVISLVDDATGTHRPDDSRHFKPVQEFVAAGGKNGSSSGSSGGSSAGGGSSASSSAGGGGGGGDNGRAAGAEHGAETGAPAIG